MRAVSGTRPVKALKRRSNQGATTPPPLPTRHRSRDDRSMKSLRITAALIALSLSACASDDAAPCGWLVPGTYVTSYTETSGTCGRLTDRLDHIDDDGPPPDEWSDETCTGMSATSPDLCDSTSTVTCKRSGGTVTIESTRHPHVTSEDGIEEVTMADSAGRVVCRSIYTVRVVKQ